MPPNLVALGLILNITEIDVRNFDVSKNNSRPWLEEIGQRLENWAPGTTGHSLKIIFFVVLGYQLTAPNNYLVVFW